MFRPEARGWRDEQISQEKLLAARFLALAQQSAEVFWLVTPDGEMREANASWQTFTGQSFREAGGRGWLQAVSSADRPQIEAMLVQATRSGEVAHCLCYLQQAHGVTHHIQVRAIPVLTQEGEMREILLCGEDLTRQTRDDRQMDEAQIQLALKAAQVGMWERDLRTNELIWTDQCRAVFGLPDGDPVTYERFLRCLHPDDRERLVQVVEESIVGCCEFRTEYRLLRPDGIVRWLAVRGRGIYDVENRPLRLIGAALDITDLKQAEEALAESEARFRRFVDSNIIGITVDDLAGNIHEANDAFLSLVGYTRADLEAGLLHWTTLRAPELHEQMNRAVEVLKTTGSFPPMETEYLHKSGRRVPALVGGTLFYRDDPSTLGICFVVDLSARKAVERQKDLFLGMASHELKTPLTALKGTLQLLQRRVPGALASVLSEKQEFMQELSQRLATALRQVDVQTRLINDLLDVSRITANTLEFSMQPCDLIRLVRETVEDLRVTAPQRALLLTLPELPELMVQADRDRISQVVTNYTTNALRYAPPQEPILVGVIPQGDTVRVWVKDRGPGLSEQAQKEVWQRFVRVQDEAISRTGSGQGLGLGLYICQTLIAQHGGQVGVQSTPGQGSTFWFELPLP